MFWTLLVLCLLAAIPLVILGVRRRARRGARLNDLRPATSNPLPDGGLQRASAALCIPTVKRTSPGHCPNCEMALVREAPTTPANGVADPVDLLEPDDGEAGGEGP